MPDNDMNDSISIVCVGSYQFVVMNARNSSYFIGGGQWPASTAAGRLFQVVSDPR